MSVSLDEFSASLSASGIIASGEIIAFRDNLDPKPKDAQTLAKHLVRAKKLTKFQAAHAYKGKGKMPSELSVELIRLVSRWNYLFGKIPCRIVHMVQGKQ